MYLVGIALGEFKADDPHKDVLRAFVSEKKLDGAALTGYTRKDFGIDIAEFGKEKKLTAKAMKLWKALYGFDIAKMSDSSQHEETKEPERNDSENVASNTVRYVFHIFRYLVFGVLVC